MSLQGAIKDEDISIRLIYEGAQKCLVGLQGNVIRIKYIHIQFAIFELGTVFIYCFIYSLYHAPEIAIIKSVMNPADNPTKIPTIKTLFAVCFLPELYISIET